MTQPLFILFLFGICLVISWSCVQLNRKSSVLMVASLWFALHAYDGNCQFF